MSVGKSAVECFRVHSRPEGRGLTQIVYGGISQESRVVRRL